MASAGGKGRIRTRPGRGPPDLTEEGREAQREQTEIERQNFLDSLPQDQLLDSELDLRELLLGYLEQQGPGAIVRLSIPAQLPEFREARARCRWPKAVSMSSWIERRIGGEVGLVKADNKGEVSVKLLSGPSYEQQPERREKGKGAGGKGSYGKDGRSSGKDGKSSGKEGKSSGKDGKNSGKDGKSSGKGASKSRPAAMGALPGPKETEEERFERVAKEKEARENAIQDFLASLPADTLTSEEEVLRDALLQTWRGCVRDRGVGNVRLSHLCQDKEVIRSKSAFMPAKVPMKSWVSARIGGELELSEDATGQLMADFTHEDPEEATGEAPGEAEEQIGPGAEDVRVAEMEELPEEHKEDPGSRGEAPAEKLEKLPRAEREARMLEYFQGPLRPEEEDLKIACIDAIARRITGDAETLRPMKLSDVVNHDHDFTAKWRAAKSTWAKETPPLEANLSRWLELRLGGEVQVSREPYVQLTKSTLGHLGLERPRPAARKRPLDRSPEPAGRPRKMLRTRPAEPHGRPPARQPLPNASRPRTAFRPRMRPPPRAAGMRPLPRAEGARGPIGKARAAGARGPIGKGGRSSK
eukprot:TRINITY_DN105702_c0_g1_i1.p1 TRINITY_DN105702_c0_g1~~TRINITY_DN105702_c0_g1_i1.p1  ORF type:complete len:598 (+),score=124.19 TRINITY_DN105702_c0_g1_i1:42-1796(+)